MPPVTISLTLGTLTLTPVMPALTAALPLFQRFEAGVNAGVLLTGEQGILRQRGNVGNVVGSFQRRARINPPPPAKAVDRAGFLVVSTALKDCLANPEDPQQLDSDELEKLFLSLA